MNHPVCGNIINVTGQVLGLFQLQGFKLFLPCFLLDITGTFSPSVYIREAGSGFSFHMF